MSRVIQGVVHGRTIELADDPGVPDGEPVEVVVRSKTSRARWGEGILRSAGAVADIPGIDEVFDEIERERKSAQFRDSIP